MLRSARGFGTFNHALGRGVYGAELQKALRSQSNGLKHTLWDLKIRVPRTNRIATGMALGRWGAEGGKYGSEEAIMIGVCFPLDSQSCGQFRHIGDNLEARGEPAQTAHMFANTARQQSRLYAAIYGEEHLNERLDAVDRLNEIREEFPEFPTANVLVGTWGRMVFQYDACVSEGVHFILSRYDEGITFEKTRRYALAPDRAQEKAWG